ncbi:MAG: extracellular solute-binding protein [Firmicutes bacterium]|nr:extracellular solute-binding protein [Bacillota bacterium]
MKRFISLLLVMLLAFSLVACNSNDVTENKDSEKNEENTELEEKIVVYSTHPEDLLEHVSKKFEEKTGVKVEFINLRGELADRVRAEKENPQSDVMFGGASSLFIDMKKDDLFEKYVPAWSNDIKDIFKDEEGYWTGTIQTPVMLFYNNEMLSEEEAPKDWSDLANPKYKNNVLSRNSLSSSARATIASLLYQYYKNDNMEEGWNFINEFDDNVKGYYGSGSLQFQAIGRKEGAVSFSVLNSIIDNKEKNNLPLSIVDAKSGSPVITDAVAVIKGAKHMNAAKAFVDFVGSPEIQAELANKFNRLPTHPKAIENGKAWMKEAEYKVMDVDWSVVSKKESEWIQKWASEIEAE